MKGDLLIGDLKPDWLIRCLFQNKGIIACPAHGLGHLASGVGFREDSGQGRLGEGPVTAGTIDFTVRHRSQTEDQSVLRREGIDSWWILLHEEINAEPLSS